MSELGCLPQKVRGWVQLSSVQHTVLLPPAASFNSGSAKFLSVSFASTNLFTFFFMMSP